MRKTIAVVLTVFTALSVMIGLPFYLFGLAGSHPAPFIVMAVCHVIALASGVFAIQKRKAWVVFCAALIGWNAAAFWNKSYWAESNQAECEQMRKDPACIESETGFTCQDSQTFGNLVTSKAGCAGVSRDTSVSGDSELRK